MARFKYKTIDTSTIEGIEKAERLLARGWKIIQSGLYIIVMEKRVEEGDL